MSATATKPATVTKKRLSVAQAADQWVAAKRAIADQQALLDEAAPVLKEHFEKTGRTTYKDLIAYVSAPGRLILDQQKVKEFLGRRLGEFQKKSSPSKSLQLLEK